MASAPTPACANALAAAGKRVERGARSAGADRPDNRTAGRPPQRRERARLSVDVRMREVRRREGLVEPGLHPEPAPPRDATRGASAADSRRERRRFDRASLDEPQARVQRHVGEDLPAARGPLDRQLRRPAGSDPGRRAAPSSAARETPSRPARSSSARSRSVSTLTRAPTASRLLVVPTRRMAIEAAFDAKSFRNTRSCGAWRAAITARSGSPSRSMSSAANDRPS